MGRVVSCFFFLLFLGRGGVWLLLLWWLGLVDWCREAMGHWIRKGMNIIACLFAIDAGCLGIASK